MQPRDFEEEVSRSAERVNRKNRRLEALDKLQSAGNTPVGSPRTPRVLVQDTQPRSPVSNCTFSGGGGEVIFVLNSNEHES